MWISDDSGSESRDTAISNMSAGTSVDAHQRKLVEDAAKQAGERGDAARAALAK